MWTTQQRNAGSSCIFGNIAGVWNKSTHKYHLSDSIDASSICVFFTVTEDIPKESVNKNKTKQQQQQQKKPRKSKSICLCVMAG